MTAPSHVAPYLPALLVYAPAGRVDKHGEPYRRFRVRIKGKEYQLGPWGPDGSPERARAQARYRELLANYLRGSDPSTACGKVTVRELVRLYLNVLSRRDAAVTPRGRSEANARSILTRFEGRFGSDLASDITIPQVVEWRNAMAETPEPDGTQLSRPYINTKVVPTVVRMLRWGQQNGKIDGDRWGNHKEEVVVPLVLGETSAPETEARDSADEDVVNATLPHLLSYVRDVVQLIRLTGARPSEICRLTPADLDRSDPDVWVADLRQHKTAGKGKVRVLSFDAAAQEILERHVEARRPHFPIFTGGRLTEAVVRDRHARRRSTPTPAQLAAMAKATEERLADVEPLDPTTVQDHVRIACKAHGIAHWTLYQLRHLHITQAAMLVGGDAARDVAGHSSAATTARYRHDQIDRARKARHRVNDAKAAI